MKKIFFLLTLFTVSALHAQVVMNDKGKCGYQDEAGNVIIDYNYDFIGEFNEHNVALAKVGQKWGMISKTGEVKVPIKYDEIGIFHQGLAYIVSGKKYGLVSENGEVVCTPQYEFIYNPNSDGIRIAVKKRNKKAQKEFDYTHTYTLLGKNGQQLFAPQLGSAIGFYIPDDPAGVPKTFHTLEVQDTVDTRSGYFTVYTKGYTIYDLEGNVVLDEAGREGLIQEIFGAKAKAKNHPYYNHQIERAPINDILIFMYNQKTKDKNVIDVAHGYYNVKTKKILKYYTTQWTKKPGTLLLAAHTPDDNTALLPFSEGFGVAHIEDPTYARTELINAQGEVVKTFPFLGCMPYKNGYAVAKNANHKWGLLDKNQNEVIAYHYDGITAGVNGTSDAPFICVNENNKWGAVTINDQIVIPMEFDDITSYENSSVVMVKKQNQWGAYDGTQVALPCQYDSLTHYGDGSVLCHLTNQVSVYSFPQKKMSGTADGFNGVYVADQALHGGSFWELYKIENGTDTLYGFVDGKADEVIPYIFNNDESSYKAYLYYRNEPTQVFDEIGLYRLMLQFTMRERKYTLDGIVPEKHWDY